MGPGRHDPFRVLTKTPIPPDVANTGFAGFGADIIHGLVTIPTMVAQRVGGARARKGSRQ